MSASLGTCRNTYFWSTPRPSQWEILRVRPSNLFFNKYIRWFWYMLNFENHCEVSSNLEMGYFRVLCIDLAVRMPPGVVGRDTPVPSAAKARELSVLQGVHWALSWPMKADVDGENLQPRRVSPSSFTLPAPWWLALGYGTSERFSNFSSTFTKIVSIYLLRVDRVRWRELRK